MTNKRYSFLGILLILIILFSACWHDEDTDRVEIEGLNFVTPDVSMKIGERLAIKVNIAPNEARKFTSVKYNASVEGYISITETSNDGCVITAERGGSVILVAKADGYTAYCEVTIENSFVEQGYYIVTPTQVVELYEGSRRSLQVSLFNGSAADNQNFLWDTESGKDNISITPAGNTIVVQGEKRGSQKIMVSHEKSDYNAEIIVFVLGNDEMVKYITTLSNIIMMSTGSANQLFSVSLVNGSPTDRNAFLFNVIEGIDCIDILSSNESCNIVALKKGTSVIRVEHPLAEYPLDIRVIVLQGEESYIELSTAFLWLDIGQGEFITAGIGGESRESWNNDFSFKLSNDKIVDVIQTNNAFYVLPKISGSVIIEIFNKNIQYSREALIVVRDPTMVPPDGYYIVTSQNIVQLDIGQKDKEITTLTMQLINGVEAADRNGFEWLVEDSSIVEVSSSFGEVKPYRAMARAQINSVLNAEAYLNPLRVGQTRIIVSHPKSPTTATVIVKVYPRGTFAGLQYTLLNADEREGGLIKVDTSRGNKSVTLKLLNGNIGDLGNLEWNLESKNGEVFAELLSTFAALKNEIKGIAGKTGVTRLSVNNQNLQYPFEAIVMVGDDLGLAGMSVLYADQLYQRIAVTQGVSVEIKNSGNNADLSNYKGYSASGFNSSIIQATMIGNRLLLQGINEGYTEVTVSASDYPYANVDQVVVRVTVVGAEISIDKPYYITGPNFIGLMPNQEQFVRAELRDNPTQVQRDKMQWLSLNDSIVEVTGNGEEATFKAKNIENQATIRVSHAMSANEKTIIAFVSSNPHAVVLGISKENWLLRKNDNIMMELITNAQGSSLNSIKWIPDDDSVVYVDYNGSKAMVKALNEGSTVIRVTHPDQVIELKIYISVSGMGPLDKSISVPSVIEMIISENKVITADVNGLSGNEIKNIKWTIDDESIATLTPDGKQLYIFGKSRGTAWITVKQNDFGFEKRILLLCAKSYDDLLTMYVFYTQESYYRIKIDEEKTIVLRYGPAGFPEEEKANIIWRDQGNEKIKLYPSRDRAQVEGYNEGITKVTVSHSLMDKPVELTFEVYRESNGPDDYRFVYNAMLGLVVKKTGEAENEDNTKNIQISITPAGLSYANIEWEDEKKSEDIVSIIPAGDGNQWRISALKAGTTYMRISYKGGLLAPARILIYTANTKAELDQMFPIIAPKAHYLLTVGDTETLRIETPLVEPDDPRLSNIRWSPSDTGIINYDPPVNSTYRNIKAMKAGNMVYTVSYPNTNTPVEKIYVSVKEKTSLDFSKKIITESIIGLGQGQSGRLTTIGHNLSTDDINDLQWTSQNTSIVRVYAAAGKDNSNAMLDAVGAGETEVVVSLGQIKRHIKVYVADNPSSYKALNIDNRYYQIRRGDELTLQAYHAALACTNDDEWRFDPLDNNVVEMEVTGKDKVRITGKNEGIAQIRLFNDECLTDVTVMIEVSHSAPPASISVNTEDWYLTTMKSVYALDPAKVMDWTRISVEPMRFTEEEKANIKWEIISEESDDNFKGVIQMSGTRGAFVEVAPNNRKGKVTLSVSHGRSVNALEIVIICNADVLLAEFVPYIVTSSEVVKMQINTEQIVDLSVMNLPGYDIGLFQAESDNEITEVTVTGNLLQVKGTKFGQSLITIRHKQVTAMVKKIVVLVLSGDNALVYLTTKDNFTVIEQDNYKTVTVDIIGYDEVYNQHFTWYTDFGHLVSVNASGKSAVITGKAVGTAEIKVRHRYCDYELTLYVKVTVRGGANPVYITTGNNIVSVREGNSIQIKASLVNGMANEIQSMEWSTLDVAFIDLQYSGDTAMVTGKSGGVAAVYVNHRPSSAVQLRILVVVEPAQGANGIYITTDNLLVEMGISENQRQLSARLIGGAPEDVYGFQWQISNQVSIVPQANGSSYRVVDIISNADVCYVQPVKNQTLGTVEGEAIITVSHPKTNYRLDIKVIVMDYTQIQFAQNYVTVDELKQATIPISSPSGQLILYSCSDTSVARVTGTNSMCVVEGLKEGTVIVTAYNVGNTKSHEMIVRVNKVDLKDMDYLWADVSFFPLMMGQSGGVVMKAEVRNASTQAKDFNKSNAITWTVINTGIVKIAGSTVGAAVGDTVTVLPNSVGETQIRLSYKYSNNEKEELSRMIYVKVTIDDYLFVVSDLVIRFTEGSDTGRLVWARVDNVANINYTEDPANGLRADVSWTSDDPSVAVVNYLSGSNNQSNARIDAIKTGSTQIKAWYRNNYTVISVVVDPNRFIRLTPANLQTMPGSEQILTVVSDPKDEPIIVTIDTNAYHKVEWRQTTDEPWSDSATKTIKSGSFVRVTGTDNEGVTGISFEMINTGIKAKAIANNVKNYFIKFKNLQQVRMKPSDTAGVVVEFEISPPGETLRCDQVLGNNVNFECVNIQFDDSNKKITIKPLRAGYTLLRFRSYKGNGWSDSNNQIELPVYIYYPDVDISFEPVGGTAPHKGISSYYANLWGKVDLAQSAICLTEGETATLDIVTRVPNGSGTLELKTDTGIHIVNVELTSVQGITDLPNLNQPSRNPNINTQFSTNVPRYSAWYRPHLVNEELIRTIYYGLIKVEYKRFDGGIYENTFTKNFLLYLYEVHRPQ
jgi:hypothetical protein